MNIEETTRKQIVQELKINHTSQNAYVVICYHAFYSNGLISIVLEYMDGGSLADIMKELEPKRIQEPNLAVVSKQVSDQTWPVFTNSAAVNFLLKGDADFSY